MKTNRLIYIYILIVAIFLAPNSINAQWSLQYSTPNFIESIFFASTNDGWVVGQNGLILHTSDGGLNWAAQNSGVSISLSSVFFIDENNGWVCGGEGGITQTGIILNTTNGGQTWNVQTNIQNSPRKIYFADQNHGWVVASSGFIKETTNAGQTWNDLSLGTNETLMDVCFVDENTGWTSGESYDQTTRVYSGFVLKTTNGGKNWAISFQMPGTWFECIHFVNNLCGWAAGGNGKIYNTTDGGIIWHEQNSGIAENLADMHFIDAKMGWIVGRSNKIIYTFDGGLNWHNQQLTTGDYQFFSVHFSDPLYGWAVGTIWDDGVPESKIMYTNNNGGDISGIGDLENGEGILVFPNPTEGEFFIDLLKTSFSQVRIDLLNITGKVQMSKIAPPDSKRISINIRELPKGIYFIKIVSSENSWVRKVIYK